MLSKHCHQLNVWPCVYLCCLIKTLIYDTRNTCLENHSRLTAQQIFRLSLNYVRKFMVAKTMIWQFDFGVWLTPYSFHKCFIPKYMQTMSEAPNESLIYLVPARFCGLYGRFKTRRLWFVIRKKLKINNYWTLNFFGECLA